MNMKCLSIPDDFLDMPVWLDDLLLSPELTSTIMELEILAGDQLTDDQTLDGILVNQYPDVFGRGLAGAKEASIRKLLRQPVLLLELQEQVLMHGGDFWQTKTDNLFQVAGSTEGISAVPLADHPQTAVSASPTLKQVNVKAVSGVLAAIAATVLFMFAIFPNGNPKGQIANVNPKSSVGSSTDGVSANNAAANSGWGFAASGLLEASLTEPQMLKKLSEASLAWYNKLPANSAELEARLNQFDLGCQELLAATLPQLSDSNRKSVQEACEDCRATISQLLADIKDGVDFEVALVNADNTINRLTDAIEKLV